MNLVSSGLVGLLAAALVASAAAGADDTGTREPVAVSPPADGQRESAPSPPIYVPPDTGAPKTRIAGTTRSQGNLPQIQVLAPERTGRTTQEQPTLWFWLSAPTTERIDVTVVDPGQVAPLLEATLPGPFEAGFHGIELAKHGLSLSEGREYRWFVAIVADPDRRSGDVVAGGGIERVSPRGAVADALAAAGPGEIAHAYARAGIWYDAIDEMSSAAEAGDVGAAAARDSLAGSVGLDLER